MSFVFIGTTGDHAGHSLLTWTMAQRLVEEGLTVGFIKPFGSHPIHAQGRWTDQDALLFKKVLRLCESLDRLCPYPRSEGAWGKKSSDEILNKIRPLVEELSSKKDVLLIMGSEHIFFDDASHGVSDILLALNVEADFVLIDRFLKTQTSIYSILSASSLLKERLKGIVLNRVPPERLGRVKDEMIPSLVLQGMPITVPIPEDPLLSYRTLEEIRNILEGEFLWGEDDAERCVGGMTVGSHDLPDGLMLLKRVYNKIILLEPAPLENGADEAPIRRAVTGILMTGGRRPAPQVLEAAKKANIPLVLVRGDTFKAMERLEHATPTLSPDDEAKMHLFTDLLDKDGALDGLLKSLGLIT